MFKPRAYDPDRASNQTPAQVAAVNRNFRIFRLHGLHAQLNLLTGERRAMAQQLVDMELAAMGALTTGQSARIRELKSQTKLNAQYGPPEIEDDQPF